MLNEADTISKLLDYILKNISKEIISEIIVVDGGSSDNSKAIVAAYKDIVLLNSEKGRAKQMNFGAKNTTGNILYFLHADSFPPINFDFLIIKEIEKENFAGCFKMKFNSNHWWLKLAGWLTQFSWRACRGGDQSLFITKSLFNVIGRFDESYMIYEDNDLIRKLYARNQFVVIQAWLTTSARRYNKYGIWKLQYYYWMIYLKKFLGASPKELNEYYIRHVSVKN